MKILAIETSCDETAVSVIEKNGKDVQILSNVVASQINIHKKFGGVFPEIASRAHTEKIIPVVEQSLKNAGLSLSEMPVSRTQSETRLARVAESEKISRDCLKDIDIIAVTTGPGLIGSLLIGVNFAKTLAYATNKPIIGINHLLGHIYSNFVGECQNNEFAMNLPQFPALILIVSGGHTGLVLMKSHTDIKTIGETLDDAAGEAFDKVAKLLELGYPGGPAISAEAEKFKCHSGLDPESSWTADRVRSDDLKLPRPMINSKDFNFSFSGLKTAVLYEVKKLKLQSIKTVDYQSTIAFEFQQAVIDVLIKKTIKAVYKFRPKSICLCGGVSANHELRKQMAQAINQYCSPLDANVARTNNSMGTINFSDDKSSSKNNNLITFHCPPMELTTDNAAMIGLAAAYHLDQKTSYDNINTDSNLKL